MISLQRSMHSSQMYTPGPAISFLTCFWLFPQKEHFSRSPPSPNFATAFPSPRTFPRSSGVLLGTLGRRYRSELPVGDDLVDDAVFLRFVAAHDEVAVGVVRHALERLAGVVRQDLVEQLAHADDLLGLDLDVDRLAGCA